jgi:hypothetical protein
VVDCAGGQGGGGQGNVAQPAICERDAGEGDLARVADGVGVGDCYAGLGDGGWIGCHEGQSYRFCCIMVTSALALAVTPWSVVTVAVLTMSVPASISAWVTV